MSQTKHGHEPMSPLDELLFRSERDPAKRSTMAAIYLLDTTPAWEDVVHAFERASREFLRLRQRVVAGEDRTAVAVATQRLAGEEAGAAEAAEVAAPAPLVARAEALRRILDHGQSVFEG